jgi:prepilin-type N-terminal cleavage/methylation domain-containing protein
VLYPDNAGTYMLSTLKKRTHISQTAGFTLLELLVVMAIISMLMAISMPSLKKAKDQAKGVVCQSNLKQWGTIFLLYTEENEGYFANSEDPMLWARTLADYYETDEMRLCPKAVKPAYPQPFWKPMGSTFLAWGEFDGTDGSVLGMYGSYGINAWVYNASGLTWESHLTSKNWRQPEGTQAANIPVFLDCLWLWGSPEPEDSPPSYDGQCLVDPGGESMLRFCFDRHEKNINGVFMDWGIRKIGLKELWKLKWHRDFNTNGPWTSSYNPQWPEWMAGFKDY